MSNYVMFADNYGEVKAGIDYRVMDYGYDYVNIVCHGRKFSVPKYLIGRPVKKRVEEEEDE